MIGPWCWCLDDDDEFVADSVDDDEDAVVVELDADNDEPARTKGEPDDAVDRSDGAGEVDPLLERRLWLFARGLLFAAAAPA